MDVLVCVKRVPEITESPTLTPDGMGVDASRVGHTVSPHEECAVEIAVQLAQASGGTATVLTLGDEDSVEQLRNALAVGCTAAVHVQAEDGRFGAADVAAEIAAVVEDHAAHGTTYDLVLLGNDAADTGDFQVPVRLGYALGRPVLTGARTVTPDDGLVTTRADGTDGTEVSRAPLPAVVAVMEGGVEPRYPSIPGRMKAKKVAIEERAPVKEPTGTNRIRLHLPPEKPSEVQVLGHGAAAAPAVVDVLEKLGVLR